MAYASPIPRSYGIENRSNISARSHAGQAATRAAYIARVVSEAPPLSDATLDRIAVLLRPNSRGTAV